MRHVLRLNEELPETPAEEKASTLSLLQCPHSAVSVAVCQLVRGNNPPVTVREPHRSAPIRSE